MIKYFHEHFNPQIIVIYLVKMIPVQIPIDYYLLVPKVLIFPKDSWDNQSKNIKNPNLHKHYFQAAF